MEGLHCPEMRCGRSVRAATCLRLATKNNASIKHMAEPGAMRRHLGTFLRQFATNTVTRAGKFRK